MPINPTREYVVHWDQNEQEETGRDAEHRDAYCQQVEKWRRQISSCCPLHQEWIDIPVDQAMAARRVPPQQLEYKSRDH